MHTIEHPERSPLLAGCGDGVGSVASGAGIAREHITSSRKAIKDSVKAAFAFTPLFFFFLSPGPRGYPQLQVHRYSIRSA